MSSVTIGLDVGGTKVAGGLVSSTHELLFLLRRPTLVDGLRDPGLAVTLGLARDLLDHADAMGLRVDGIGAGFPEYVDLAGQLRSHEVLAWTRQPAEMLADLAPVTVESDVRCGALAEGIIGAARGLPSYSYVVVGTGISYALVEGGRARAGARGEAIALGELECSRSVDASAAVTLERFASGQAICERFTTLTARAVRGAADVFRLAARGDRAADAVIRSAGEALGYGLGTMVHLIDPGAVVMGGGVSGARGAWREALESSYAVRLSNRPAAPPLLWASPGGEAGIIGAVMAHRRRMGRYGHGDGARGACQ
jgi:glucokinase